MYWVYVDKKFCFYANKALKKIPIFLNKINLENS